MPADEELPVASQRIEVVDPHNPPAVFVDWIVTGGSNEGVINVTLGSIDHSLKMNDSDLPRIVIASRLRFSQEFGVRLHAMLGRILGLPPVADEQAPEPAPVIPKNMVN